jgi:hypothetical protein
MAMYRAMAWASDSGSSFAKRKACMGGRALPSGVEVVRRRRSSG